ARRRLQGLAHVDVQQAWLPQQWPERKFDLVVFSELGFYFDAPQLDTLIGCIRSSLREGATVLACHWRHPVVDCELDGDAVHRRLQAGLDMPRLCAVQEEDFRLTVWCQDSRSVARREGFV
ncbi:MAG: SAM-dependent methyltransferase, partial [Burkholderiaceae bacterium]